MQLNQQLRLTQKLSLKQLLLPKMIQMLRTFQMPYADLVKEIELESKENVFIEHVKYDQLMPLYRTRGSQLDYSGDEGESMINRVKAKGQSFHEFLISQLNLLQLGPKEYDIADALIQAIDAKGYIPQFDQVKAMIKLKMDVQDRKIMDVLKMVQSLEPDGVGARDLKECLLIQIDAYDFDHEELRLIIRRIITYHFNDLANQKFDKIAQALNIQVEGVSYVAHFIKENLSPTPGSRYSDESSIHLAVPSFEVQIEDQQLIFVNLEKQNGVEIRLSESYQKLLSDPKTDEKTKAFLQEKLKKAQELIDNLKRRYETLDRLAKFILNRQDQFIRKGTGFLEPLLQKQVAADLGLTPSTVSRIVSSKYIQTPHGVFALKSLCPRCYFGKTLERFKILIQDAFIQYPTWSDNQISQLFKEKGMQIARRTITKYRLELGIQSKIGRKKERPVNE